MKVKLKMDPAQIKALLLAHVEKAVFGVVVVCFLLLLWKSFGVKPYPKKPGELEQEASRVQSEVEKSEPPSQLPGVEKIGDFSRRVRLSMRDIDPRDYPIAPLNRPPVEQKVRRKEPVFLAARDLVVYSDVGILALGEQEQERKRGSGAQGSGGGNPGPGGAGMPGPGGAGNPGPGGAGMPGPGGGGKAGPGGSGMPGPGGAGMSGPGGAGMPGPGGGRGNKGRPNDKRNKANEKKQESTKPDNTSPAPQADEPERFALRPPAGATYEGRYWVCVTALVPYAEQVVEYSKVFQHATKKDPELDEPRYDRFEVQRALVKTPGQPIDEADWENLDMDDAYNDMKTWFEYPEVVDPMYIDDAVTWFMPPLVGANHDPERVRHPRIPLAGQATKEAAPTDDDKPVDKKKGDRRGGTARGNRGDGAPGGGNRPGGNMAGGNRPGGDMAGGNMAGGNRNKSSARGDAKPKRAENKLFRFFDTTVAPGTTYRYRVRLELNNPNFGLEAMFLDTGKRDLAMGETRATAWSEPSVEIFVPRAGGLLAGEVAPATGAKESQAQVMVKSLDPEKGIAPTKVFDVKRGTLINEKNVAVQVPDYATADGSKTESVDFETNATCLDMLGGDKLPGGGKAPGRVLVVEANGELAVLDQFADVTTFDKEQRRQQSLKNKSPGSAPGGQRRNAGDGGKKEIFELGDDFNSDDPKKKKKRGR